MLFFTPLMRCCCTETLPLKARQFSEKPFPRIPSHGPHLATKRLDREKLQKRMRETPWERGEPRGSRLGFWTECRQNSTQNEFPHLPLLPQLQPRAGRVCRNPGRCPGSEMQPEPTDRESEGRWERVGPAELMSDVPPAMAAADACRAGPAGGNRLAKEQQGLATWACSEVHVLKNLAEDSQPQQALTLRDSKGKE